MKNDEFAIIDRYFKSLFQVDERVIAGPGDDCAILNVPDGSELCVSTDTLTEGVHFPDGASARLAITRTMAANLSDLAAMGADPHSFVLAINLPTVDDAWLSELSSSLAELIEHYDIPLVGGNLSKGQLTFAMTVMGTVPAGRAIRRDGASPGDDLYVTGTTGDAAYGLKLVTEGEMDSYLSRRYREPAPRIEAGLALRDIASAMIDVSDGLLADAAHLAKASQAGLEIDLALLPLSNDLIEVCGVERARQLALRGGDDYELCFTAAREKAEIIESISANLLLPITRVGRMTEDDQVSVLDENGDALDIEATGYQHF